MHNLSGRFFLARVVVEYESSRTPECEIFTRLKISAIPVVIVRRGLCVVRLGFPNSMKAILAFHPTPSISTE